MEKQSSSIINSLELKKRGLYHNKKKLNSWVSIKILKIRSGRLILKGYHTFDNFGDFDCFFKDDKGRRYKLTYTGTVSRADHDRGDITLTEKFFETEITIKDVNQLDFIAHNDDGCDHPLLQGDFIPVAAIGTNGKLYRSLKASYYAREGYIVTPGKYGLKIRQAGTASEFRQELRLCKELISKKKLLKIALIRLLAVIGKKLRRRPLWIISDRDFAAGDNGEAMFRFLSSNRPDADVFFALDKRSADYSRIKKYGKVLDTGAFRYRMKFLLADKIISSQTSKRVTNAFGRDMKYVRSLYDFDTVFLQHGIIVTDLSSWFRGYNKDLSMMVTSSRKEYESVLGYGFNCDERMVKLTGMPRYDYLTDEPVNTIAICPTWRTWVTVASKEGSDSRDYVEDFKDSEYCRYFNALINDERLLGHMRAKGYKGMLYIHPALISQAPDFIGNDVIGVCGKTADYNRVFRESNLMVTDYSSVMFDFAYLGKPVILTQFDKDLFFEKHHCKEGIFDYEKDGFGPVRYDLESTIDAMIEYIDNDCPMPPEYAENVDEFFAFRDRNNCRRVYEELTK